MAELLHPLHPADLRSLTQLLESWPDAVLLFDGDDERFLFANAAAERLIGMPRAEILQKHPSELYHPEDTLVIPAIRQQAELDGSVRRPWRILRRDGVVVATEMTMTRRRIDGRTLSQGIFRIVRDSAENGANGHMDVDARLKMLERTSLAVVTLDREGVVTSWNPGAVEQFQMEAHETVGRQIRDLVRSDQDLSDVESLMRPHELRDEWVSKLTIRRPGIDSYDAMVTCSAIRTEDGELTGFLLITAPLDQTSRATSPRMRRARVQCAACGREVAGTMRRKYCSEKCRQWAYYHRHLDAQRARSRQRHERRRGGADLADGAPADGQTAPVADRNGHDGR